MVKNCREKSHSKNKGLGKQIKKGNKFSCDKKKNQFHNNKDKNAKKTE